MHYSMETLDEDESPRSRGPLRAVEPHLPPVAPG